MKLNFPAFLFCLAAIFNPTAVVAHEDDQPSAGSLEQLGEVNFPISCSAEAQQEFNRAVAILHSFFYPVAVKSFTKVTELDPSCAMGYWGVAMSWWYPLWYPPTEASLKLGKAAVDKAQAVDAKTERERDYIAAIAEFYKDFDRRDHKARALGYEKAMEQVHKRYAQDSEAAAFYALALQATIDPNDKAYAHQLKSAAILEPLFVNQPKHPGLAHYIIHAYDYPGLADRALDAARRYGKIAPSQPHALHMPSHTFIYLGLWEDSIQANLAANAAAQRLGFTQEELHTMDYLAYAYLQGAQERAAKDLVDRLAKFELKDEQRTLGTDYAIAAVPARYAVERRRWSEASSLTPRPSRHAAAEAMTYFARAIGAAHSGAFDNARKDIEKLTALRDALQKAKQDYWAKQVDIQRQQADAWLAHAEGNPEEALKRMRAAAELEDSTYKHPVTPGQLVPAHELLGDLLLELQQPAQALAEFEIALRVTPNRFNGIYGAARAAELAGDRDKAKDYYAQLLALSKNADGQRPELSQAKAFLASK